MKNKFEHDIQQCVAVLKRGGLILYPTDTIWGIGCDAGSEQAVEKIFSLKRRPDSKTMIVLAGDFVSLNDYVAGLSSDIIDHLDSIGRPTTVIFRGAKNVAPNLVAADGTLAIRVPKEKFCRRLLRAFGKPIVSTSANISGEPSPALYTEIGEEIKSGVDYVVKYRQDDERRSQPSAIVKWEDGKMIMIRE